MCNFQFVKVALVFLAMTTTYDISCHAFYPTKTSLHLEKFPSASHTRYERSGGSALGEHTLNQDSYGDDFMEEDGPKYQLLQEIGGSGGSESPRFGFGDTESSKSRVEQLINDLSGYVLPLEYPSQWKLLYNTAPDVLGFRGGPLSQLVSIRQEISDDNLDIMLEYKPSENIQQLVGSFIDGIGDDQLVQTVRFGLKKEPMNKFDIEIQGTNIESSRMSSLSIPQPNLQSPFPIPFVGFSIVFNDGDLRVDRSIQGDFLSIYKRIK